MRKLVLFVVLGACGGGHKSVTPSGGEKADAKADKKIVEQDRRKAPPDDPPPPPPPPPDNDTKPGNTTTNKPPDIKDFAVGMSLGGKLESGPPSRDGYDSKEIAQVVQSHSRDFKKCYQDGLAAQPGLSGKVVVRFKIGGDGKVVDAVVTTGMGANVDECVARGIRSLAFPPKGTTAIVSFPFIFASG